MKLEIVTIRSSIEFVRLDVIEPENEFLEVVTKYDYQFTTLKNSEGRTVGRTRKVPRTIDSEERVVSYKIGVTQIGAVVGENGTGKAGGPGGALAS